MEQNKDMKLSEFASLGGKATSKKYGKEHYQKLASHMNKTIKEKYGEDYYKELSKKGLEARRKKKQQADAMLPSVTS